MNDFRDLVGSKIIGAAVEEDTFDEPGFPYLDVETPDGTRYRVFVMSDEEGNGAGALDISQWVPRPHPTLPLFTSGNPHLAQEASSLFGNGTSEL